MDIQNTLYAPESSNHYNKLYKKINKMIDEGLDPVKNYNNPELHNSFAKLCYLLRCNLELDDVLTLIYSDVGEFYDEDKLMYLWYTILKNAFSNTSKNLSINSLQNIINTTNFGEELLVKICYCRNIDNISFPNHFINYCSAKKYVEYVKNHIKLSVSNENISNNNNSNDNSNDNDSIPNTFEELCDKITNQKKALFISQRLFDDSKVQKYIDDSCYDKSFNTGDPNLVAIYKKTNPDVNTYEELLEFINTQKTSGFMSEDMWDDKLAISLLKKSGYAIFRSALGVHIMFMYDTNI